MIISLNCVDLKLNSGGIARTNLLVLYFLSKFNIDLRVLVLNNYEKNLKFSFLLTSAFNLKIIFFIKNFFNQLFCNLIIYYHPGLARSHLLKNKDYICFIHGIDIWNIQSQKRLNILKKAKYLIACSQFTINKAQKIHNTKFPNALVIYPGTNTNDPPKFVNKKSDKFLNFLIIGRIINSDKGHLKVIDSFYKLSFKYNNIRFYIVGTGPFVKKLKLYVKNLKLQKKIIFTGFVPENKMQFYWDKAHVFIMPSVTEGFGLVYIEAMRQGIPIIASKHDAASEININNVTGFNVNLNIKYDLQKKIEKIIKNKKLREKMGKNSYLRWKNNYTLDCYKSRFDKFFQEKIIKKN